MYPKKKKKLSMLEKKLNIKINVLRVDSVIYIKEG